MLLLVRCLGIGGLLYACYLYGARPWVADAGLSLTLCSIVVGVSTMAIGDNEFHFSVSCYAFWTFDSCSEAVWLPVLGSMSLSLPTFELYQARASG